MTSVAVLQGLPAGGPLLERLLQGARARGRAGAEWGPPRAQLAKRNRLCFFSPVTCYK